LILTAVAASVSFAATTATWELNGYQDFLRGRMSGLSITRDGHLTLGPKLETVFSSDQAQIWSVATASDGSLYLGTGNRGRLLKVDPAGNGAVVWTSDQPEIFAVAIDRAGVVYAGTSPDGKVYRIENGRATEYFSPGERYIWALAFAPDGSLYVATGQQGKIYRVVADGRGAGKGELYYETGQSHVTALALDRDGRLLAGSEPNGILYRITGTPARGFVLYDANLPEIRSIIPTADGSIYAAALGGSLAKRTSAASSSSSSTPTVTAPATSITVTDAQAGLAVAPKPDPSKPTIGTSPISAPATTTEVSGVERSALYKILPDNTVETLWTSKDENIYDVVADAGGTLTFLTDVQGRVYRLDPRPDRTGDALLVTQTNEADVTRLAASLV
jgi:WD40 repeat protein